VELILHIGTEKTGTTSVQNFFRTNREKLAKRGVLYPVAPGQRNHTALAAAAQEISKRDPLRKTAGLKTDEQVRKFRGKLLADLERETKAKPFKLAVMSNEHCSSRLLEDGEVQWLHDKLAKLFSKTRIVVYLRRQDDYLLSTYSTSVKSGGTQPLALPTERKVQQRYDHWDMLSRWARIFGRENVVARRFEKTALKNGDIVDDLLEAAGIELAPAYEKPQNVNESLDGQSLEFLRLFNKFVPRFAEGDLNPVRGNIADTLSRFSDGPLLTLPERELAEFQASFADSNAKVAAEYFGGARPGSDDPLFERRSDNRARVHHAPLTVERAVELGALLWQEKQAQVNRLAQKLKDGRAELKQTRRKPRSEDA